MTLASTAQDNPTVPGTFPAVGLRHPPAFQVREIIVDRVYVEKRRKVRLTFVVDGDKQLSFDLEPLQARTDLFIGALYADRILHGVIGGGA